MLLILEGIVLCFFLLLICVIGMANGPLGLVMLYEKDVQERVLKLGLITSKELRQRTILVSLALWIPLLVLTPYMVYGLNQARTFAEGFWQITLLWLMMGLFDRLFIDWYWVSHTKAWIIPGTEDLRPYIPKQMLFMKWIGTLIGFPLLSALVAWLFLFWI